ncbi:MAG: hypothetical protein SGI96_10070 [Bacteroidota bacterium]|nr:hypothetical protein [Bacteroidota bacterium]
MKTRNQVEKNNIQFRLPDYADTDTKRRQIALITVGINFDNAYT